HPDQELAGLAGRPDHVPVPLLHSAKPLAIWGLFMNRVVCRPMVERRNVANQKLPAISLGGLGGSSPEGESAHDPLLHPELYDGVALRRIVAYFLDMVIIGAILFVPWMIASVVMVVSLGLIVLPMALGSLIFIVLYDVLTIGGPASATPGM